MKSRLANLLAAATLAAATAIPAIAQTAGCGQVHTTTILNANRVRAPIHNDGGLFWKRGGSTYRIDGVTGIFAANLLIGGQIDEELHFSGSQYGPYEFWPGPADSMRTEADCERFNRMYQIAERDFDALDRGMAPSQDMIEWPWRLGAPVVDGDGNPDNYNLLGGDRPELLGREMIWWVMNDVGGEHERSGGRPLGVEVHGSAFAVPSHDPSLDRTTFYRYRIFNRNDVRIDSLYVGFYVDVDLGAAFDDYIGSDSLLGMGYVYNGDDEDDRNFGVAPPALGLQFISGPEAAPDDYDSDYDGAIDEPGERLRMSHFVWEDLSNITTGPPTGSEMYDLMQAHRRGGVFPFTEGGRGGGFTDKPIRYMFPADPPDYWSEMSILDGGGPSDPGDRRFYQSAGPFTLEPGEYDDLFFAVVYARGSDHLDSVYRLKEAAATLQGVRAEDIEGDRSVRVAGGRPALLTPGDGADLVPRDAPFNWTQTDPAARYQIELTETGSGSIQSVNIEKSGVRLDLRKDAVYSWRVRKMTSDEYGSWSEPRTLSTGDRAFDSYGAFENFLVVRTADGPLNPPQVAASLGRGFPVDTYLDLGQIDDPVFWFISSRSGHAESYETFVRDVAANHVYRTVLSDYEIRFTGSSAAVDSNGVRLAGSVPFEIWDIGDGTPDDTSDDVRLIPMLFDSDDDGWGARPGSGDRYQFRWTDPFAAVDPRDRGFGQGGYTEFAEHTTAGMPATDYLGSKALSHLTLTGYLYDLRDNPDDFPSDLPEEGTVFRIQTGDVPVPRPVSPGPGERVPADPVTLQWMNVDYDLPTLEVARTADFLNPILLQEDAASGLTLDPLAEGTYFWRLRGAAGLSQTWSFTVATGVDTEDERGVPERFDIGRPYPNPASESVTLPVQGHMTGPVTIGVFDVLGRRVTTAEATGSGPIRLDVSGMTSGVYVLRAEAEGRHWTRSIIVRR